jgi:hypothetical protein
MTETITKTALVPTKNARGADTVRLSDEELHRAARKGLQGATHEVFGLLPATMARVIEHKVWRSYGHKDFASYALDTTSNGLGINNNQSLWLLRCAMDVHGEHIKEWAVVLDRVDQLVRVQAATDGMSIRLLSKEGLESLAKNVSDPGHGKITYLPSRQSEFDGHLIRLRKNKPDVFKRVVSGELSMVNARREARAAGVSGMAVDAHTTLGRAKQYFEKLTAKERREFLDWLREEGWL